MKKIFFLLSLFALIACIPTVSEADSYDPALANRLAGRILIQVEKNGEAWYVNPLDQERYYLGRPADAYALMRQLGLGVSNANLSTIAPSSAKTIKNLPKNLSGRILLQVESKGEAWYVNPSNAKRYYLGRPEDAFKVMRQLGLGISDDSLYKIKEHPSAYAVASPEAAMSVVVPDKQYRLGDTLTATVAVNASGLSINTAAGRLYFDDKYLELIKVSKEASVFDLWINDPSTHNSAGNIDFAAGILTKGLSGRGELFKALFRLKKYGQFGINLLNVDILANDGLGTSVGNSIVNAFLSVSDTKKPTVAASASRPGSVITVPVVSTAPGNPSAVSQSASYPKRLSVYRDDKTGIIEYSAVDDLGIDHYELTLDDKAPFSTTSQSYKVAVLGAHRLQIKAFNKTGNFSSTVLNFSVK